jgi:integrase/recombinase XerD
MLGLYRRHQKHCPHLLKGREHLRCPCPLWIDGRMNGERIHKALGTTDWQKAQQIVRELETGANCADVRTQAEPITLNQAWLRFMADLDARKLHPATVRKYRLLQKQMEEFVTHKRIGFLHQLDIDTMGEFRSGWKDAALSASKKLERLKAFFRFAVKRKWIAESPVSDLKAPRVSLKPTMPFTHEEMGRILEAVNIYCQETSANGRENACRLRALVLILRFSGMRLSDVVALSTERFVGNRLFLYTAKTGVPVHIVVPEFVVRVLGSTPRKSANHFFWSGVGQLESIVRSWQTRLRRLFQLAGVAEGHAHRFRDTFAVELLLAGIPIERVSILLGHQSKTVTEKHYNPWVRSRQEQLEADLERAWSRDPLVLVEAKVTRRLRGERERVN